MYEKQAFPRLSESEAPRHSRAPISANPVLFLEKREDEFVILDGIRLPKLFCGVFSTKGEGEATALDAFLCSVRQPGESLAGRIEYVELRPFSVVEVENRLTRLRWPDKSHRGLPGQGLVDPTGCVALCQHPWEMHF